jgi:hypothetical protein
MHGTFLRNLSQPSALLFRKISNHQKFYFNDVDQLGLILARGAVFSMHPRITEANLNAIERSLLSVCIHSQGDADTRTKRRRNQLKRVRSSINSTQID